jgi:intracellular multiplication protein IcmP
MPPPQQSGSQDPGSSDFVWISIILVAGISLAWYFGHKQITNFIYQIRLHEIQGIQWVLDVWNMLAVKIRMPFLSVQADDLQRLAEAIQQKKLSTTSFDAIQVVSAKVGDYLRIVVAPLLFLFALIIYFTNLQLKLKVVFDMQRMRLVEQSNRPQITPVLKLNLVKEDIDIGPWAMAMTPMQFCKKHGLLKEKTDDRGKPAVDVIGDQAYQVFVRQLGPLWTHVLALPPHAKAIFAALAACGNHDREAAFELLDRISKSSAGKSLDFLGTDALLAKHFNTKLVIRVLQRHAYVTTIFLSMMELARTDGVFATSEFLWLKPLDRKLWYVLNTVGRHTAVPEASGPYAHWRAEIKWGGPLRTPMMEEAVKAMESALIDILYDPEEEQG